MILGLQLRGSDRFRGLGVRGSFSERCGGLFDASQKGDGAREKRLLGLPRLAGGRVPWLDRLISLRLLTSRYRSLCMHPNQPTLALPHAHSDPAGSAVDGGTNFGVLRSD